jgi:hypothetical protein
MDVLDLRSNQIISLGMTLSDLLWHMSTSLCTPDYSSGFNGRTPLNREKNLDGHRFDYCRYVESDNKERENDPSQLTTRNAIGVSIPSRLKLPTFGSSRIWHERDIGSGLSTEPLGRDSARDGLAGCTSNVLDPLLMICTGAEARLMALGMPGPGR